MICNIKFTFLTDSVFLWATYIVLIHFYISLTDVKYYYMKHQSPQHLKNMEVKHATLIVLRGWVTEYATC